MGEDGLADKVKELIQAIHQVWNQGRTVRFSKWASPVGSGTVRYAFELILSFKLLNFERKEYEQFNETEISQPNIFRNLTRNFAKILLKHFFLSSIQECYETGEKVREMGRESRITRNG